MAVSAPFRFARINRWIYEPAWARLVSHDVPFADGLSGEMEVEITARSSILVGGDRRAPAAADAGEVRPFQLPDGSYAIPDSTLQGMTRAVLEIAGFGRLGPWVEDRKFGIRDLSGSVTAREHYQRRLSENRNGNVTMRSRAGWLVKTPQGPVIYPCDYARIHLDDIRAMKNALGSGTGLPPANVLPTKSTAKKRYDWFLNGLGGVNALSAGFRIGAPQPYRHNQGRIRITYARCTHAPSGGTPGTLVLTGKPQNGVGPGHKKLEFVFHSPDRGTARTAGSLPVDDDVWAAFQLLHEEQPGRPINPNWDFWKGEFANGDPVPVFYWQEGGRITTLGTAFAFKAAHLKSARDLLAHSCEKHLDPVETMGLDLAHLIFGVAAEHDGGRGLKRRARFGLARALGAPSPEVPANPSILLGPKPSYAGLYVRQRNDNRPVPQHDEPLATYTPLAKGQAHLDRPELAGVKVWPAKGTGRAFAPAPLPRELAGNLKVQAKLVTLPPGTVFRSRLTFHNLRPVELGALLWALSFGEAAAFGDDAEAVRLRHRLGMGKPLDLGEVSIRLRDLTIDGEDGPPADAVELVRAFERHMQSDAAYGPDWARSKQVAALRKAATPSENAAEPLGYMTLQDYQQAKARADYLPDYVPEGDEKPRLKGRRPGPPPPPTAPAAAPRPDVVLFKAGDRVRLKGGKSIATVTRDQANAHQVVHFKFANGRQMTKRMAEIERAPDED